MDTYRPSAADGNGAYPRPLYGAYAPPRQRPRNAPPESLWTRASNAFCDFIEDCATDQVLFADMVTRPAPSRFWPEETRQAARHRVSKTLAVTAVIAACAAPFCIVLNAASLGILLGFFSAWTSINAVRVGCGHFGHVGL